MSKHFRPCAGAIVFNKDGKVFLGSRIETANDSWQFPQGGIEAGEIPAEAAYRELYEETGLQVRRIISLLPPSYSAVGFSDTKTYIAFVEAEGEFTDHTSENEQIRARFYGRDEIRELLRAAEFSSRSQMAAYFFAAGMEPDALAKISFVEEGRNRE